jgi:hypothetical protein
MPTKQSDMMYRTGGSYFQRPFLPELKYSGQFIFQQLPYARRKNNMRGHIFAAESFEPVELRPPALWATYCGICYTNAGNWSRSDDSLRDPY